MVKVCSRCKEEKEIENFRKKRNGHQAWCTPCFRNYDRERYAELDKSRKNANAKKIRDRQRQLLRNIKSETGCVDCGIKDYRVLDFDHTRGTKYLDLSLMVGSYSDERLLDEVGKCDVRCANCHRVITHERRERGRR